MKRKYKIQFADWDDKNNGMRDVGETKVGMNNALDSKEFHNQFLHPAFVQTRDNHQGLLRWHFIIDKQIIQYLPDLK